MSILFILILIIGLLSIAAYFHQKRRIKNLELEILKCFKFERDKITELINFERGEIEHLELEILECFKFEHNKIIELISSKQNQIIKLISSQNSDETPDNDKKAGNNHE